MHDMEIVFPGGKRVDALFKGYRVETDQKRDDGSAGDAIEPFDLFIASIGTCAGIYALQFCRKRGLDTEGLKLIVRRTIDPETRMVSELGLELLLPRGFPEKYRKAIVNAVGLCSVKKHLDRPPAFRVETRAAG